MRKRLVSSPFRQLQIQLRTLMRVSAVVAVAVLGANVSAQTVRTWTGNTNGAWLGAANWSGGTSAGSAPNANYTAEGTSTDIMSVAAENAASNIGINFNTLQAAGGVGLIFAAIDFNKTNTTALTIGNSATATSGILQLNGATVGSVPNTLIRVSGSADLTLANDNAGTDPVTMGLRLGTTNGVISVDTSRTLTLAVAISEATTGSGFTKTGPGTVVLSGGENNTYSGTTTVNAGNLNLSKTSGINAIAGNLTVGDDVGAAGSAVTTLLAANQIALGSTITVKTDGTLAIGANSDTVGTVVLAGGSITGTGGTLTGSSYDVRSGSVSAILGGTNVNLSKTTSGTVTLSGANSYTGTTSVTAGTLLVNGNQTNATGNVTVSNGGTVLGGTGTIGGAVTLQSAATLQGGVGTTSGALTLAQAVDASAGIIQLALGAGGAHSSLIQTAGTWTFGDTQLFSFINSGATAGTMYDNIISGLAGTPNTDPSTWTIANPGWAGTFSYDEAGGIDFTLTAVPEPSTYAAGILAAVAVGWTQRRRFATLLKKRA